MSNVNHDVVEAVLSERYPEFDRKRLAELVKRCKEVCYQSTLNSVESQIKDLLRPIQEARPSNTVAPIENPMTSVFTNWRRKW